jgi:hypothetical protein
MARDRDPDRFGGLQVHDQLRLASSEAEQALVGLLTFPRPAYRIGVGSGDAPRGAPMGRKTTVEDDR